MEDFISIIVPIYNVESYLERCVDSLISQTYTHLEIILVDDGSKDKSGSICDEYASKDKRIKVIHKRNGGLSDARNVGFENSNGKYIFFLDSDDWIESNAIEVLFRAMKENNADIVVSNYLYQYDDRIVSSVIVNKNFIFTKKEAMQELLKNEMIKNFAWGKLYKREMIDGLQFPVGKLFEDTYWTHLVFDRANKVVFLKEELVNYYQRNDSISYTFDIKRIHLIEGNIERRKFIQENYPNLIYLCDECIISLITGMYIETIKQRNFEKYMVIKMRLRKYAKWLLKEINLNLNEEPININKLNEFCISPTFFLVKEILRRNGGRK